MPYTIEELIAIISPIADRYGVKSLSLFGSYARGDASSQSDLDLLVDKGRMNGLFEYYSFLDELETALNLHVDLVTTRIQDRAFLDAINGEKKVLYEGK